MSHQRSLAGSHLVINGQEQADSCVSGTFPIFHDQELKAAGSLGKQGIRSPQLSTDPGLTLQQPLTLWVQKELEEEC